MKPITSHARIDKRGVDLISDVLPFGCLWYGEPHWKDITFELSTK
jgi:hypothetical protein